MQANKRVGPLSGGFMLFSMLALVISLIYTVYSVNGKTIFNIWFGSNGVYWGVAFIIVFAAMFVASMWSMAKANPQTELKMDKKHEHNVDKFLLGKEYSKIKKAQRKKAKRAGKKKAKAKRKTTKKKAKKKAAKKTTKKKAKTRAKKKK